VTDSEDKNKPVVALYGLGNMGFAVAEQLARAFALKVHDPNRDQVVRAMDSLGAQAIDDISELRTAHAIVLCLPRPSISLEVIRQVAPVLNPDTVIIESSTVNPEDIQVCVDQARPFGIEVVDASILAGVPQMRSGEAMLAVGGSDGAIDRIDDVLQAMSARQIRFGPSGAGAAAKVVNNAVAHAVMVVVAEAGAMATAAGVNTQKMIDLLSDSKMGLHRPLTYRYAERVVKGDYEGGMSLDAARKDSELALRLAQTLGVPLFAIQSTHSVYEMAACAGLGRQDYASLVQLWEGWGKPVTDESGTDTAS